MIISQNLSFLKHKHVSGNITRTSILENLQLPTFSERLPRRLSYYEMSMPIKMTMNMSSSIMYVKKLLENLMSLPLLYFFTDFVKKKCIMKAFTIFHYIAFTN